jgi:aspartyl-tRNA(Asn)/glutamyl-tRNA(Gln) amidotransferase subunit C
MTITDKDVRHVARLSRLAMGDEEINTMTRELGTILEHIGKIGELELDGIEPTTHAMDVYGVTRPDVAADCLTQEQALANAPATADGGFSVPRMQS